jgi:formate dehydrogenase subunit gamma
MPALLKAIRLGLVGLGLIMFATLAGPANAQRQPVDPTANAVNYEQLLKQTPIISGRGTIPDVRSYNLVQPAGRDWRHFHETILPWIGAVAILGMLAILVVFYLWRGMVRIEGGRSGRTLVRFNGFERFVHWMTATCFILLAISGLNISFGKRLLLPLIGADAFADWSQWAKYAHNYLSFPFTLGVILIFLMWIAWNIPNKLDVQWFRQYGGMVGKDRPPADRFNGGQKAIYWIVVLGGGAVAASGYILMFPFYVTDIAGMQLAQMSHAIISMLFIAAMLGHIYIGTIGMEGAFEAMGTGEVDLNWAKEHHSIWVEHELGKGRAAAPPDGVVRTPAQ